MFIGFLKVYDELTSIIVNEILPAYKMPKEVSEWNKDVSNYCLLGGLCTGWIRERFQPQKFGRQFQVLSVRVLTLVSGSFFGSIHICIHWCVYR